MSTTPGDLANQEQERKRKKRGAIVKFSLAGVALLGIGAAATSAAWTDDAWFKGAANVFDASNDGDVQLSGSLNGTTWSDANSSANGVAIDIAASAFQDLLPGETRTVELYIKNTGHTKLAITSDVASTGPVFAADGVTATLGTLSATTLAATDTAHATLTITAPAWDNSDLGMGGDTGALTVDFTGTVTH